jgi:SAM-dependent methyltransferase
MKKTVVSALRKARVLDQADRVRYRLSALALWQTNRRFRHENPGFAVPPPKLLYEISSSTSLKYYHQSGVEMAEFFWRHMLEHLPHENVSVCEWGCGVGRILRHVREIGGHRIGRLVGLDYNKTMVEWCRSAIPGVEFHANPPMPPTGLADSTFDAVYCWSVFTHLSHQAYEAWLPELLRIVRPGGVVLFTTSSDRKHLLSSELATFDSGGLVVRVSEREGSRTYVSLASPNFIYRLVGDRPVVHIPASPAEASQDLWIVQKTAP